MTTSMQVGAQPGRRPRLASDQLNAYDVLVTDDILFTRAAYETFTGVELAVEASRRGAGQGGQA